MKKLYPLLSLLFLIHWSCGDTKEEESTIIFSKTFGVNDHDRGYSVQQTPNGGYIITGSTQSFGEGNQDVWLIKTDSEGNIEPYGE